MSKVQYRIVESRNGTEDTLFYQVQRREWDWINSPFKGFWSDWSPFGECASEHAQGYGARGLHRCKAFIKEKTKPKPPETYYAGKVVYTQDFDSLSDAAQFLQQVGLDK